MSDKVFLDTNILVYLFSKDEPKKRSQTEHILTSTYGASDIAWSTQVVQEFYNTMTRKLKQSPLAVKKSILLLDEFELINIDFTIILSGIDIQILNQLSFWDSLIVAAAGSANCGVILSEDLNHGQKINGIEIINPY